MIGSGKNDHFMIGSDMALLPLFCYPAYFVVVAGRVTIRSAAHRYGNIVQYFAPDCMVARGQSAYSSFRPPTSGHEESSTVATTYIG
jgi:hypothetical protein